MKPAKLPGMTEKAFMAAVVKLAKLYSWKVYHTFDSRRSAEGFPDLVLVKGGTVIFAELKSDTGRETDPQKGWRYELAHCQGNSHGAVQVYLWRPDDLEAITAILAA